MGDELAVLFRLSPRDQKARTARLRKAVEDAAGSEVIEQPAMFLVHTDIDTAAVERAIAPLIRQELGDRAMVVRAEAADQGRLESLRLGFLAAK